MLELEKKKITALVIASVCRVIFPSLPGVYHERLLPVAEEANRSQVLSWERRHYECRGIGHGSKGDDTDHVQGC
jgi:hypothetical protein